MLFLVTVLKVKLLIHLFSFFFLFFQAPFYFAFMPLSITDFYNPFFAVLGGLLYLYDVFLKLYN